jgi:hypothetical protein
MGRQADEKLPETEARGVAAPSHHPSPRASAHAGAVFFPRIPDERLIHARG